MARRVRSLAVFVAALALPLAAAAQVQDLLDAYRLARAGDPVLRAAEANLRSVGEFVVQARAPLLPQAAAGVGLAQTHGPDTSVNGTLDSVSVRARDVSASVSQVLVDVGQFARLSAAKSRESAEAAAYHAAEQALIVRVAQAYFDVLVARDLLATTEANEAAYLQQVTQSQERYRQGLIAMVDVDQARAYHASAQSATIAAKKAVGDAIEALAEITGVRSGRLRTLREDAPLIRPAPEEPEAWVSAALAGNLLIQAQQRTVQSAGHLIEAARAGHLPTVNATLDVGRPASWPGGDISGRDGRTVTTVGVLLRIPLFTGGLIQSSVRQAIAQRDVADADLESVRRRVARETLDHHSDVIAAIGQIEAGRIAVDAAAKALASTRVGQQLGTHTMTDLLLAIQTLSSAQATYSVARHRLVVSELQLKQSAGQVSEMDLQNVNALLR
ncbi:MAG TPA: TolC family outer membrane protein [Caldimonas sp.]|nr:TolC family outer membrane protein [Caldimonas sp.]